MSVMTRGVIEMPYKLAMGSELNRRQFYSHAQVLLADHDYAHKHWANASNNVQAAVAEVVRLTAENEQLSAQMRLAGVSAEMTVHQAVGRAATDTLLIMHERDQLKAENEALRKDAERLQSATAFVQKLCDSAGKQPSVATGYLHDILSAMGKGEQS